MTVDEFLSVFETKFRAAKPQVYIIPNPEDSVDRLALRLGAERLCPIEWCAYTKGVFHYAGPKLGLSSEDVQTLVFAADYRDGEEFRIGARAAAVRQRLLAIVGLSPETEAQL